MISCGVQMIYNLLKSSNFKPVNNPISFGIVPVKPFPAIKKNKDRAIISTKDV